MAVVQKIPFLRLVAALAAGIVAGKFIQANPVIFIVILLCLTGLSFFLNRNYSFRFNFIFGIGVHLIFASIGLVVFNLYNQKPVFYQNGKYHAEILEILEEKPNSFQSVLKINSFFKHDSVFKTSEKVMVYFEKTDNAKALAPGRSILFLRTPQRIKNNNNPFEFDYKAYLAGKKIYRQVYLTEENWKIAKTKSKFSLITLAERTRLQLMKIYFAQNIGENEMNVLSALTLGYKRGLDPETKRIFSSAGAMHVLAVSGLHVGIVFLVVSFVFGFLKKQKSGRVFYVLLVIPALWGFAFITGLSPSVQRAATMFTFVVVGENTKRRSNIYNTLAASAFFLLLINPNNLFEAGFQLSYAAVFGIVFLQPRLVKLFHFKYKIPQYLWELLTVSVAAQIATFPVTAFYFNQFPTYFWISNLLVIPAVILLIPLGFSLLLFHWVPGLSTLITSIIKFILSIVIHSLSIIEKLPFSVAQFTLSFTGLVFLLGAVVSLFLFIETRHKKYFKGILMAIVLLAGTSFFIKTRNQFRKEIIVYNHSDQVLVHFIRGKRNYIVSNKVPGELGYALNTVKNTVRRLQTEDPVFLNSQQAFFDKYIFLKNGLIVFDGRVISLHVSQNEFPENIVPELIIDPPDHAAHFSTTRANPLVISPNRFPDRKLPGSANIFYLREKGAFREKW